MKRGIKIRLVAIIILLLAILIIFLIRLFSPSQLDDVSPEIPCSAELLEKADALYIIPKFNNQNISNNSEFCAKILALNKTIELHGVYHTYKEFLIDRNQDYLNEGIKEFENCFKFSPERFKPPQLEISENNKKLIKNNNLKLEEKLTQVFHKVYHCNDSGNYPNYLIDLI